MKTKQIFIIVMFQVMIIGLFASCTSAALHYGQEINNINYSDFAGEKITVQIHKVFGHWYHASLRINLDSDLLMEKHGHYERLVNTDENGIIYITLGAGPKNVLLKRKLIAEFNRPRDVNEKKHTKVETHDIYLTIEQTRKIIDLFESYGNDLNFAYFPENRNGRFNSNSFISGILTGIELEAPVFNKKYKIPGYNKPIPLRTD